MTYTAFDSARFFDEVRQRLYNGVLSQSQVDGMNFILRGWRLRRGLNSDARHPAYCLATTHHETAFTMQPITEYGSVDYLLGKEYYPYIGRGYVQLTWEENYAKAGEATGEDLLNFPDLALEPDLAAHIMFEGMENGWFTGRCLKDYFNDKIDDPVNARQIINGNDKDIAIAEYYFEFLEALEMSLIK